MSFLWSIACIGLQPFRLLSFVQVRNTRSTWIILRLPAPLRVPGTIRQ
jgi:hypothetical protein